MPTSHHVAVHRVLAAHAAPCRTIAVGADGVIGRAQCHFESQGDGEAVALLGRINLALFRLRQALRLRDETEAGAQRAILAAIADQWRDKTPLFEFAQLFPTEGNA